MRKAIASGKAIDPVDRLWLDEYNQADQRRKHANGAPPPPDVGASRKTRRIALDIDEAAESVGTGDAATAGALGALREREEGRRLDALTMQSTDALKEACAVYRDMCLMLKDQVELMMSAVTESMVSARTHYLAAAQMEAALMQAQSADAGNPADNMMMAVVAKHLGIDPAVLRGGVAAAQAQQQPKQKGGANGVAT
jgi:hypothetical protein